MVKDQKPEKRTKVIAVDGPAGSGKSSVCSLLAQRLGWSYVNTGAIYRSVGLLLKEQGVDLSNEAEVAKYTDAIVGGLSFSPNGIRHSYEGRDITGELHSTLAGQCASAIAKMPLLRTKLLPLQRSLAMTAEVGAVVDGRDIGTVVFPEADLKIFLTASLEARAKRRADQLGTSTTGDIESIRKTIASRDGQDSNRDVAPLKKAADAIELDTTTLSLEQVVQAILVEARKKGLT